MSSTTKPNLIFFLSSFRGFNTGVGGHYRSVAEFARLLSAEYEIHVITFGDVSSPVFEADIRHLHVYAKSSISPHSLAHLRNAVSSIVHAGTPQCPTKIISTGLNNDYAPIRISTIGMGIHYFHIKPGGKAARSARVFDGIPMAVFHDDDMKIFASADPSRQVVVTPGRVSVPLRDEQFLRSAESSAYREGLVNIACIMRISDYYEESITLIHSALASASSATFTHYGTVQSVPLHERLVASTLPIPYSLITDKNVTAAAAKALHPFQAFIGLGRSALEALSLAIPTFVPVKTPDGGVSLVAVTKENWLIFSRANFTARVALSDLKAAGELITIVDACANPTTLRRLSDESYAIYADHFSPEASKPVWIRFLSENSFRGNLMDIARSLLLFRSELKRAIILVRAKAAS